MKLIKPFNEMSVLFPLLTLYTLAYLALMGYDFAAKEVFEIPSGLMAVYITLVLAYSADREIRRWIGKELPLRKGTLFVYLWLVFYLVVFIIRSLKPEYALPNDLTKVTLQVLGIFFGSKLSKKIFQVKKGTVKSVFSILKGEEGAIPKTETPKETEKPTEPTKNPEEVVLDLIRKSGRAKREELLPVTGMSRSSLGRLLEQMEKKGSITQVGKLKWSYYVMAGSKGS
ncbi:MAG: hypothetical protein HYT77_05330 [Deltaproteobacteria bacterium]|nr:hypothetical protein [Deltaproteobacteria bacterium]